MKYFAVFRFFQDHLDIKILGSILLVHILRKIQIFCFCRREGESIPRRLLHQAFTNCSPSFLELPKKREGKETKEFSLACEITGTFAENTKFSYFKTLDPCLSQLPFRLWD